MYSSSKSHVEKLLPELIIFNLVKRFRNRCLLHDKDCIVKIKKCLERSELMRKLHGNSNADTSSHSKELQT